jgi:hypothetical protein
MIKLTEKELIFMRMALSMKGIGKKINKMEMGLKHGQTDLSMKGNIKMGKSTAKGFFGMPMGRNTVVNLMKIKYMGKVYTNWLMETSMTGIGLIIKWTGKVFLNGKTEDNMKEVTQMIKRKDKVLLPGLTAENMKESGILENNMDMVFTPSQTAKSNMVNGKMVKE